MDLATPTGPVIGAAVLDMSGPRQSGAYNATGGTAPMDLEGPPSTSLQLPKIGGQARTGYAAI
eukprot:4321791-Karenia_brevis.AAC.1